MKIAFRVDASAQIGTGHFMRCLTLANQLKQDAAKIRFISRHLPEHLRNMLAAQGHEFSLLDGVQNDAESDGLAHSNWLGGSQKQDATDSKQILSDESWDWLVVDHYALDIRWESVMRPCAKFIMVIDDLADRSHDCDLLLDQNYYLDMKRRYHGLVPEQCVSLLGPAHVLLRPEFTEARQRLKARDGRVRRILVFFGGSDLTNQTQSVIESLNMLGRPDIGVDIVVGADNPNKKLIQTLCNELQNVAFHCQVQNMAELVQNADLGIGAGGAAMWERCFLGLPTITVVIAANQEFTTEAVASVGAIEYLGWYDKLVPGIYAHILAEMIENPQRVKQIGDAAFGVLNAGGRPVKDVMRDIVRRMGSLSTRHSVAQ